MSVDYEQELLDNEAEKKTAIEKSNAAYDETISSYEAEVDKQQQQLEGYKAEQTRLQQEQTDFAIDKINQQREQAEKDYTKEQQAAYGDYKKQTDPYGINAEQMASLGLSQSGYNESSKVAMYTAYQNRVAAARASIEQAKLTFDNAIREAKLTNDINMAKIAQETLEKSLALSMESVVYLGNLGLQKAEAARSIDQTYYNRAQDIRNAQQEAMASGGYKITGGEDDSIITGNEGGAGVTEEKFVSSTKITEMDKYLSGLVAEGSVTEDEAMAILEGYIERFKDMVKSTEGWSVVDDGGANIFGIDRNAIVKAPNGEQYSLKNLMNQLVDLGMSKSEARKLVKALQDNLGGI